MLDVGQKIELKIESLAIGGDGIGRSDGLVVFVPYSAPGDVLEVLITENQKSFLRAEIVQILKASASRRTAPCPYFAKGCGGCSWQHIEESEQLKQKENLILSNLKKFLKLDHIPFQGMIPSPHTFRYRNRIQPHYLGTDLGFFKKRSHQLVPFQDCLITEEAVLSQWPEIQKKLSSVKKKEGQIEASLNPELKPHWRFIHQADDTVGFSQVNRFLNEDLVQKVVDLSLEKHFSGRIIDLYSGAGNFTFPLSDAHKKKQVLGVELSSTLASSFRQKTQQKNIPPQFLEIYNADVEHFLGRIPLQQSDFVLLDPPRIGASPKVMRSLGQSGVHHLIYVSCHPVTLARDLSLFFEESKKFGHNYSLVQVFGYDLFPQTDHVETLVQLRIDSL